MNKCINPGKSRSFYSQLICKIALIAALMVTLVLLLSGCAKTVSNTSSSTSSDANSDVYYLQTIETTDIHGCMVDISSGDESTYQYRLARIADVINDARSQGDVLLLDTGDCYQGNVISNKLNGEPIRAYLDACKYDAVCLGNHEFDWGLGTSIDEDGTVGSWNITDTIQGDSSIPVLCWDLYYSSTGEKTDFTQDYVIVEKTAKNSLGQTKTYKIALFGYIDDYSNSIDKSDFKGYEIHEDDISAVEAEAKELEQTGQADISVMICHVGPDDMSELVQQDSAFDLVVCGHTHQTATGNLSNGVPYLLGGCYGRCYATAQLAIENGKVTVENKEVTYTTNNPEQLYDTADNQENLDKTILDISHASIDKVNAMNPELLGKLGYITSSLTKTNLTGSVGENTAANWAATMIAKAIGADVGMVNSSGIRDTILIGTGADRHYVTGADIYSMLPFGDDIYEYQITYEQLYKLCCQHKINSYSYFAYSGITAHYSSEKVVSQLYLGDELIYDDGWVKDKNTQVKIAVNSFVAGFNNLCFVNLAPINNPSDYSDNATVISYLKEKYRSDQEIPVDTSAHLIRDYE